MSKTRAKQPDPKFMGLVIPITEGDVESGELDRLAHNLGTRPGFKGRKPQGLRAAIATAFGYPDWSAMVERTTPGGQIDHLPHGLNDLFDLMAWRLYENGYAGPFRAMTAMSAIWSESRASFLGHYNRSGQRCGVKETIPAIAPYFALLGHEEKYSDVVLDPAQGRIFVGEFQGDVIHMLNAFWTPNSKVPLAKLLQDAEQDAWIDFHEAIELTDYSSSMWPQGLYPTEYVDEENRHVGYGWVIPEIGGRHTSVFAGIEGLIASGTAFWLREPTAPYAMKDLPAVLTEVPFENPLRRHARTSARMTDLERADDAHQAREESDLEPPDIELLRTKDGKLTLQDGVSIEIDGEAYVRPPHEFEASTFERLGLVLMTDESLSEDAEYGEEDDWLVQSVPLALNHSSYKAVRRMQASLGRLAEQEHAASGSVQFAIDEAALVAATSKGATRSVAPESEGQMQGTRGAVACEAVDSGEYMIRTVYPELRSLPAGQVGEYALGFYGKNGVRHDRKHETRDVEFLAYSLLRNVGVSVRSDMQVGWGFHRLIRECLSNNLEKLDDPAWRRAFELEARSLSLAIENAIEVVDSIDVSTSRSRREFVADWDAALLESEDSRRGTASRLVP